MSNKNPIVIDTAQKLIETFGTPMKPDEQLIDFYNPLPSPSVMPLNMESLNIEYSPKDEEKSEWHKQQVAELKERLGIK